jgi:NAD(P)-dependent dehydrogenase (short-subunit alcohol dehydrogenase family)
MKYILVAGGTSGIGLATVKLLAARGYCPISVGRNEFSNVMNITCDLNDVSQISNLRSEIQKLGIPSLDGIFFSAGGGGFSKTRDATTEMIDSIYRVDFRAALLLVKELLDICRIGSSIVLCSSAVTSIARPGTLYYGALKAAVESLTVSLAAELGPSIRVNCVAPGAIRTPLYSKLGLSLSEVESSMCRAVPLRRMGEPTEVAEVVEFLLSSRASYVSGAIIPVHGGGLPNRESNEL